MKYTKLIFVFMLIILTLSSCEQNTNMKSTSSGEVLNNTTSSYETEENNLQSNEETENMENYQLAPLKDGDKVAVMKTTNGTMTIKLFPEDAPKTVLNFMMHAQDKYYDGLIFHRVINNFMIQGGDPEGTGRGGVSIYGEKFEDEFSPKLKNIPNSISMANAGPNTNGSQFFINQVNNSHLDGKHSVFGQVVEGIENIDKIAKTKVGAGDKPVKDIKIISLEIKEYQKGQLKDIIINKEAELEKIEAMNSAQLEEKKDKSIEKNDVVSVHYTGTFEDDTVFDSSVERGVPLEFQAGVGKMIPGFDAKVIGMKIGETATFTLEPKDAYGEYDENNKQIVPKTDLKSFTDAGIPLEVGTKLPTQMGDIEILAVDEDSVTLNGNHALAGKSLTFEIEIMDIK